MSEFNLVTGKSNPDTAIRKAGHVEFVVAEQDPPRDGKNYKISLEEIIEIDYQGYTMKCEGAGVKITMFVYESDLYFLRDKFVNLVNEIEEKKNKK